MLLTLPHPPLRPSPKTPLAICRADGRGRTAGPGEATIKKEAMWWAPEPWRHHSCQLRVAAPAPPEAPQAAEGGRGPSCSRWELPLLSFSGTHKPRSGSEDERTRRRNPILPS